MHIASIGISKLCFLFSLALCGLLFLLIPALKPPAQQLDWPRPRAQVRPQRPRLSNGVSAASDDSQKAESTTRLVISLAGQKALDETENTKDENYVPKRSGDLQGTAGGLLRHRGHDLLKLEDIFIAVKTTRKYHTSRLELLIKTWISQAKEHVRSFSILLLTYSLSLRCTGPNRLSLASLAHNNILCPSDVLHPGHSQREAECFNLSYLLLPFSQCHCL